MLQPYFTGRKEIARGEFEDTDTKAHVSYSVFARWENVFTSTARCGATETYSVNRVIGVSREQKEVVQAALTGSLGADAIAKLESKISAETSITIKWNAEEKKAHDFSFTAPKCGRYTAVRYQLIHDYELHYSKRGWLGLRTNRWDAPFSERLDYFHDGSSSEENDPSCGCATEKWPRLDGLMEAVSKKFGFVFPFARTGSVVHLFLPGARVTVMPSDITAFVVQLPTSTLAPDLLFLAGESHANVDVAVTLVAVSESSNLRAPADNERISSITEVLRQEPVPILSVAPEEIIGARFGAAEYATA